MDKDEQILALRTLRNHGLIEVFSFFVTYSNVFRALGDTDQKQAATIEVGGFSITLDGHSGAEDLMADILPQAGVKLTSEERSAVLNLAHDSNFLLKDGRDRA